jgi:hypothetical protein
MNPVTLQINLAPTDFRHARFLLQHQVETWREQVAEILLVIDLQKGAGRFAEGWEKNQQEILELAHSVQGARVVAVDYSAEAMAKVSKEFFGGRKPQIKDHRGGPSYCYFFGLQAASQAMVLHSDADMFFGGRSQTWLSEALRVYRENPDILITGPLSGPPRPGGGFRQLKATAARRSGFDGYILPHMSTRLFLLDRERFRQGLGSLRLRRPGLRSCLLALIDGNSLHALPEDVFTEQMNQVGMIRFDFLGSAPGCWSLHPPFRSADFYAKLPQLIAAVEKGQMPEAQLGDHDINGSQVDWSEAHARMARQRWWRRLLRRFGGAK